MKLDFLLLRSGYTSYYLQYPHKKLPEMVWILRLKKSGKKNKFPKTGALSGPDQKLFLQEKRYPLAHQQTMSASLP